MLRRFAPLLLLPLLFGFGLGFSCEPRNEGASANGQGGVFVSSEDDSPLDDSPLDDSQLKTTKRNRSPT